MLRVSIRTKILLTETMAVALGRAEAHWAFVQTEARRSSVPDLIRQTVAAAQTSMFSAEAAKFRQTIRDDLTRGEAKISLADFQADNSVRLRRPGIRFGGTMPNAGLYRSPRVTTG